MKKIAIIEDQKMFREMVVNWLRESGEEVIWEAGSLEEGRQCLEEEEPWLLILDMDLPDGEGYSIIEWWQQRQPQSRILVLTAWVESYPVLKLRKSGVMGVVDKLESNREHLEEAIGRIKSNKLYYTELVTCRFRTLTQEPLAYYKCLTMREEELLKLLGLGLNNAEAAEHIGLSESTVQGHRRNILRKLGLRNTPELMRWAVKEGFVKPRNLVAIDDKRKVGV